MTPAGNNLHTSPLPCGVWCGRGLAARPFEGMGQLCFPLVRPRTPWGARRSRCRRDVSQSHRYVRRLRRCEPPPPQNVHFDGDRVFRGGLPNCAFGGPRSRGLPQVQVGRSAISRTRGPRPLGRRKRRPLHQGRPARGRRRFAPPCRPSREQLNPRTCLCKGVCLLLHDAGAQPDDRRWTRRRPSSGSPNKGLRCRRAGRS